MGVHADDNNLLIIKKPQAPHFYLEIDANNGSRHETIHIVKHNKFLAKQRIKSKTKRLLSKYKH